MRVKKISSRQHTSGRKPVDAVSERILSLESFKVFPPSASQIFRGVPPDSILLQNGLAFVYYRPYSEVYSVLKPEVG